eukprot:gene17370-20671_t
MPSAEQLLQTSFVESTYRQSLDQEVERLRRIEGYDADYDQLADTLSSIAEKTSQEILATVLTESGYTSQVPFGSVAYMPGKLIHTNEILVHLGESHYVERLARLEALELQEAQEQSAVGSAPQSPGDVVAYEEWRARQAVLQEEAPHPVTESSPPPLISEVIPAGDSLHQSLSSVTEAAVKEKKPKPSASSLRQGFFAPAPPRSTAQRKVASDHGDKTAQQAGVPFVGK